MLETWGLVNEPPLAQLHGGMGGLCDGPEEASSTFQNGIRKSRVFSSESPMGKPLKHMFQIVGTH